MSDLDALLEAAFVVEAEALKVAIEDVVSWIAELPKET
jgi:hypothetical protein